MAVFLSPVGGVAAQFFTSTGAVLTGGKLFTYLAGTTTPAATYTTSNGATAWTNPVVLDAAGRVPGSGEIWLTDGALYKFVLKDANDVLIATYDNISGINSNFVAFVNQQEIVTATAGQTVFNLGISYQPATNSLSVFVDGVNQYGPGAQYSYVETDANTVTFNTGLHVGAEVKFTTTQQQGAGAANASQVTYDPPFTGGVATNVEVKLAQYISVKDFGAVCDGVTDDSAAVAAAITAAAGRPLLFDGVCHLASTTSITTMIVDTDAQIFSATSDVEFLQNQPVRPEWFGAKADAGVTDNRIPFEKTVAALPNGGTILLGVGTYSLSHWLINVNYINVIGAVSGTIIDLAFGGSVPLGYGECVGVYASNCTVTGLRVTNSNNYDNENGIGVTGDNNIIRNNTISGFISLGNWRTNAGGGKGVNLDQTCEDNIVDKNFIDNCRWGVAVVGDWITQGTRNNIVTNNTITACDVGVWVIALSDPSATNVFPPPQYTYLMNTVVTNNYMTDCRTGIELFRTGGGVFSNNIVRNTFVSTNMTMPSTGNATTEVYGFSCISNRECNFDNNIFQGLYTAYISFGPEKSNGVTPSAAVRYAAYNSFTFNRFMGTATDGFSGNIPLTDNYANNKIFNTLGGVSGTRFSNINSQANFTIEADLVNGAGAGMDIIVGATRITDLYDDQFTMPGTWDVPLNFTQGFLWIDTTGKVRTKTTRPTSDTDGVVVGTQT